MEEDAPAQEGQEEPAPEPIAPTQDEALAWLHRTKPAVVLALLKDPELAFSVSRAFLGFRPDAKGYANPLVRSRLAQTAVKEPKLAEKLRALADLQALIQPVEPKPIPAPVQPASLPADADPKPDSRDVLRAERDQRRRERDEARAALGQAEADRSQADKARGKAETERDEAARLSKRQAERIARLERQVARLHEIEAHLLKALGQDKVSPPPSAPARASGPAPAPSENEVSPWLVAIRHLLDKSKFDQALALAEDVLKAEANEASALDIAARALEGKREARQAALYVRRLLALQAARGEIGEAAETLLRLLRLLSDPAEAAADVRPYLAALRPDDGAAVEAAGSMLSRLRGLAPAAHAWLTDYITTQTALGPTLMPPPGAFSSDDPLPLKLGPGQIVTARRLAEAVDRGNAALVDAARATLEQIQATDPLLFGRVWAVLEQTAADDSSRLLPLRRPGRGPIVVDGSNVAWFDQESLVSGKPRLRHLREMRRALRLRGFFPVVVYADANLPYFIDDAPALRLMRDRRELTLVDAGTVADEVLLRMAKHLGSPLVTNDKMEDWDPEGEVTKIRYTISMGGEAHLLSDL